MLVVVGVTTVGVVSQLLQSIVTKALWLSILLLRGRNLLKFKFQLCHSSDSLIGKMEIKLVSQDCLENECVAGTSFPIIKEKKKKNNSTYLLGTYEIILILLKNMILGIDCPLRVDRGEDHLCCHLHDLD